MKLFTVSNVNILVLTQIPHSYRNFVQSKHSFLVLMFFLYCVCLQRGCCYLLGPDNNDLLFSYAKQCPFVGAKQF